MKFVKGDAVASLLIIAVNLIGGITIGCAQHGMSLGRAGSTYSLLAIGDGLIAQIPALLTSLASGLVVTRIASDDASNLGVDIARQLAADPRALFVASGILLGLGLIPGFPTMVFVVLAAAFGAGGWMLQRHRLSSKEAATASAPASDGRFKRVVTVRLGCDLIGERTKIEPALAKLQTTMIEDLGIPIPDIVVVEAEAENAAGLCIEMNRIPLLSIVLRANEGWSGERVDGAEVRIGPDGREWSVIEGSFSGRPGALSPVDVAVMFVRQVLLRTMGQLVGIQETQALISRTERFYGDLVREAMRSAPLPRLAEVLRRLLEEGVSVRDMRQVLEAVAEWASRENSAVVLTEHVRVAMRQQISHAAAGAGMTIAILLVEDDLAAGLMSAIRQTMSGDILEPPGADGLMQAFRAKLDKAMRFGQRPAIITTFELRSHLSGFLRRYGLHDVCVLSHMELAPGYKVEVVETIGLSALKPQMLTSQRAIAAGGG
jgi:type III secretion protein V